MDIAREYESAVRFDEVPLSLSIKVKNYCENLRSALDYLAHEIFEWLHPVEVLPRGLYFPTAWEKSKAEATIEKQFPELKKRSPALWSIVHDFQPYRRKNKRLRHFLTVLNDSKHWDLVPQRSHRAPVGSPTGNSIGPVAWHSDATGEWVTYRFRGLNENAFWILLVMHEEIRGLVECVQRELCSRRPERNRTQTRNAGRPINP